MISSVSAVSFKANPQVAQDPISRVGAYTKQPEAPAPKKNHKFLKVLAGVVAGAIVVSGALIFGARNGRWFKALEQGVTNATFMQKAGDALNKAGTWLDTNAWQKVVGLVGKLKPAAEETIENPVV